ncbi:hypothetical protein HHI36_013951 [Cryptolaemus montrouzieri]|uniref:Uncharacterized protein n=1 Tax=Cryptolaemus montrouzieri TaxID=559131 RepID=A0ABD2N2A7_9CUCU
MHIITLISLAVFLKNSIGAPTDQRRGKSLYYDFGPNSDYELGSIGLEDNSNYVNEEDIARTIPPSRRKSTPQKIVPANAFNSPIYYIALPPQPYIFVPGMGYMSQPPPSPAGNFLNLPVNFVANGKPSNIYQWSGSPFSNLMPQGKPVTQRPTEKPKPADSSIINLDNKFVFNGKPSDSISVLRDSYNALYSDALENFYL